MTDKEYLELHKEERSKCEVFCRVMGFIRPVNFFNVGKKQEFKDRKFYVEDKAIKKARC